MGVIEGKKRVKMLQLRVKRYLTQSEKQRFYVDHDRDWDQSAMWCSARRLQCAARVVDSSQNIVLMRKLLKDHQQLDRQMTKSLANLNGEKHLVKLKYNELLNGGNSNCKGQMENTFYNLPGFRFHSNGDIQKVNTHRPTDMKKARAVLRDYAEAATCGEDPKDNLISQKDAAPAKSNVQKKDSVQNCDLTKEIQQIEKDLQSLQSNKDLKKINKRIAEVKRTVSFLKGHTNDVKISPCTVATYIAKPFQKRLTDLANKKKQELKSPDRFSRKCSRSSCVACEFRLKNQSEDSKKRLQVHTEKRWQIGPRGVYVKKMEPYSTASLKTSSTTSKMAANLSLKKATTSSREKVFPVTQSSPDVSHAFKTHKDFPRRESSRTSTSVHSRYTKSSYVEQENPLPLKIYNKRQGKNTSASADTFSTEADYRMVMYRASISNRETLAALEQLHRGTQQDRGQAKTRQDKRPLLSMPNLKKKNEEEQSKLFDKVQSYLATLPQVQSTITTWRDSKGKLTSGGLQDDLDLESSDPELTWAQYQKKIKDKTTATEAEDVRVSNGQCARSDPDSVEELSKCRYLRLDGNKGQDLGHYLGQGHETVKTAWA